MRSVLPAIGLVLVPSLVIALPADETVVNAPASAAESAPENTGADVLSVERPGDGRAVCGLGAEFHGGRRAELRSRLGEGLVLVRGLPATRGYHAFRQDKTFWYLTGVESPGAALLMNAKTGAEILFLPPHSTRKESWEGELWDAGDDWVPPLTGFDDVRSERELEDVLREWIAAEKRVWVSSQPHVELGGCFDRASPADQRRERDLLDGRPSREAALRLALEGEFGAEVLDAREHLDAMRRVKTPPEIEAMRRASRAGAEAMAAAMRSTRPGVGEWELDALMTMVQVVEGASGPAYHAIAGSGPNSCVLHYSASSRRARDGEVVLIDYAPEVDHYVSDITRTWPVGGKFSPRMAELYDVVLEAQAAGIAAVKPGVTMRDVNAACDAVMKERGFGSLIRHGACHYIGMEVHDVGRGGEPVVPGVAFTVEPGLYDEETGIGIRIEDVVMVTEDGCEVLSAGVPKDRASIEALIAAPGLLDDPRN